jgi:hypothetical protein
MKLVLITGKAICPYCGHVNKIGYSPKRFLTREVIYCDSEEGGCDEPFAVFNQTPRFDVKAYKIVLNEMKEEVTEGKPIAEIIPDENEPPEDIKEQLNDYEIENLNKLKNEVEVHTLTNIPEEQGNIINVVKPQKKFRGPRGPYKKTLHNPTFLSETTVDAIIAGKGMTTPGIQGTKTRFIVKGAYINGGYTEATEFYKSYVKEKLAKKETTDIMTWFSWVIVGYPNVRTIK